MSAFVINLDASELKVTLKRLEEFLEPALILNIIGARLVSYVEESFKTKGRGKWKPLAWSTVAMRQHGGSMPLQDTGHYKQSFVTQTDGKTYVEVGSNLKTAGGRSLGLIHEAGTGPYTIHVKKAKVLAAMFGSGVGGSIAGGPLFSMKGGAMSGMFFGKVVHHPGIPPRPVLPSTAEAEQILKPVLDESLANAIRGSA